MNNIQKRFALFLFGCMAMRAFFVYLAKNYTEYLPIMGLLALMPMVGFIYIWLTDSRKTGTEVFGDKIWWNSMRPIHGALYGIFSYMALTSNINSWRVLLLDMMIGLGGFMYFHFNAGNFKQLMI